ncbi:SDR family NAD(P)-dependent oxidoreductase [Halobacillus amylolyticus]|uniref:SDR family oxidoreductase n=1 Tax=Halobacillus amylolyticus TaxID=2932259 RepID=A0ABY4HCE0_9BACI|nr:SDR family oxidoreductase [Halobacillus amylolyticus]UOR11075.1 SDR family oxidoreductase [Halobacillus amylolyticus]
MKKTIMITGGSKGLGKSLALGFAKQQHRVAICARGENDLKAVEEQIETLGAEVVATKADMSDAADVEKFVSIVEDRFGSVDVLINNASIFGPGPRQLLDYTDESFSNVLKVNLMNPFLVTKRVLPGMIANRSGSVINLTSEAGRTGFAEWGAYGISKFAIEGMAETWAAEVAEYNIRINMVDPGEIDTAMHDRAVPDCDYDLAQPEERLDVFFYLASDQSSKHNGERFEAATFVNEAGVSNE